MHTLQARGGGVRFDDLPAGSIHAWPLPMGVAQSNFQFGSNTTHSPSSMKVEVALSKCAGDFSYWQSPAAAAQFLGGNFYPCGNFGSGEAASVEAATTGSYYQCTVPAGEQWYLMWRVVDSSCPLGQTCGQVMYWY